MKSSTFQKTPRSALKRAPRSLRLLSPSPLLFLLFLFGCQQEGFVRAAKITNRTQAVGGPSALADVGDFILENDQIRVAILQGKNSLGPGVFGGSLVDADLRRPEPEFRNGQGLDQWGELFPTANLIIPHPIDEADDLDVFVLAGGNQLGCPIPPQDVTCAIIRVQGRGDNFMSSLSPLAVLLGTFSFRTDYVLRPGARHVEIITTIDRLGADFGEGEVGADELPPFPAPRDLLGVMIGADSGNPDHQDLAKGVATGDFVIFGKRTSIFSDGVGFDEDTDLTNTLLAKGNPIANPFAFPYLVAAGDRVSYGYVSLGGPDNGGDLLIPIFTSAVTVAFTHFISCLASPADDGICDNVRFLSWRRAFIVGDGDVGSILREAYKLKGLPFGEVSGLVFDRQTGAPISGAQVFAFADPLSDPLRASDPACAPLAAAKQSGQAAPFSALIACTRLGRDRETDLGVASEMKTDLGTDNIRDGDFRGPLLPGDYFLVAWTKHRLPSEALPISISAGQETQVSLSLEPAGRVLFEIRDERGQLSPAKLTFLGLPCDPAADVRCDPLLGTFGPRRLVFGDSLIGDGISDVERTISGRGEIAIEPGRYRVLISRGPEYSLDEIVDLDIPADGRPVQIFGRVARVVDTTGWISGDFHVHGVNSFDSGLDDLTRVASFIVEGVDLLSSSDHDFITDFTPALNALGAEELIKTQVGLEATTLELGHYIGFPLVVDSRLPSGGAIDWTGLTPAQIMDELRRLGTLAPNDVRQQECVEAGISDCKDAVIMVPHPRDGFFGYFDQYGLDTYSLAVDPGFFQVINPLQSATNFSDRFDAFELMNGKRFDFVRTPTIAEIAEFAEEIDQILNTPGLSNSQKRLLADEVSRQFVPRVLSRSAQEQQALGFDEDEDLQCVDNAQCGPGAICDPHAAECVAELACTPGAVGNCPAGQVCDPTLLRCVFSCQSNRDCRPDEVCNPDGTCTEAACDLATAALAPNQPCPEQQGVIEDWFRFLNFGIKKTGMASSDTHDLDGLEAGLPRTFICSDAENPAAIDPVQIAEALREGCAFASSGPIVDFTINGERLGSLVSASGPVVLGIKVQTPGWFDVTRVEVYRNGELLRDFDVAAPNTSTLAFAQEFTDDPPRDAWYVVIALGEGARPASIDASTGLEPRNMSPVYTSVTTPNIAIGEALSASLADVVIAGLRLGDVLGDPPPFPQVAPIFPYAVTNPIYVDNNQNGVFDPPGLGEAFLIRAALSGLIRFPLSSHPSWKRAPTLPDDFVLELRELVRRHRWFDMVSHHGRFR